MPDDQSQRRMFAIFNEVGIIAQLSRAMFEARLPEGVLLPHFSLINHLMRVRDGQTPLVLARAFQVPKTTMTHIISVAVKHGWVELHPNPKDGRSKTVWLTDAGRAFRDRAIADLGPDLTHVADALSVPDQEGLLTRLTDLRIHLDRARDAD